MYDLTSNTPLASYTVVPAADYGKLPTMFIHGGEALLGINGVGQAVIWHLKTGVKMQTLQHGGKLRIFVIEPMLT